jgi:ATP-dependent RNA circularization protein (DNA/RNA ligase family)
VAGTEHDFWRVARKQGLIDAAKEMLATLMAKQLTIRGELVGPRIQKNLYRLKDLQVFIFDVLVDYAYVEVARLFSLAKQFGLEQSLVPTLAYNVILREFLNGQSIKEASNGTSVLANTTREGLVIKPMQEMTADLLGGRLVLKQRSPVYLAKTDF